MGEHSTYQSPFSWRYGSPEMRKIWSLEHTRILWRRIWVVLAESQVPFGLLTEEQAAQLRDKQNHLDLERSLELESHLKHDLMAELQVFAAQCPEAGGVLHLGATSMDIKDNSLVLQQKEALELILSALSGLLSELAALISEHAELPVMGFTHLQPAEPTTLGYRLAQHGQDLLDCYQDLSLFSDQIKGKGFTGAVGTSASFAALLGEKNLVDFQKSISEKLDLEFFPVVSQTYPRLQDYRLLTRLTGLGAVLYKFAFDLRFLQSPAVGEIAEPFGTGQVGSSAMPFKQNPIGAEKINSLGRYLAQLPRIAWDNAAHNLLERTLDDSANRRLILPQGFLCLDEMLGSMREIVSGLQIHLEIIQSNLADYGPFAATEKLLMALVKVGADRQVMHENIREQTLKAWDAVRSGKVNPLIDLLAEDSSLRSYLDENQIRTALKGENYLGDASQRARVLAERIRKTLRD
jgi:adenylosuccinate lyase